VIDRLIDAVAHRRSLRRWARIADSAPGVDLETLRGLRLRARQLRRHVDRLLHVADGRLALPLIEANAIPAPLGSDWSWRPEPWRGSLVPVGMVAVDSRTPFGDETTLFHDCESSEITFRQIRNTREADLAPFGVRLDVFRFDGSFLSLAVDLPDAAVRGLQRRHLIRVETIIEMEKPLEIFARLNIRHGPNTEQMVRELPLNESEVVVDFDLAYTKLNEKRVEKAWLDLIFEGPQMNQVVIRDVTLSRRPRAEL
jgi:hypothetical protein